MKWGIRPCPLEWEGSAISILKESGEDGKGTARHAPRAERRAPRAARRAHWGSARFPWSGNGVFATFLYHGNGTPFLLLGARVDPLLHSEGENAGGKMRPNQFAKINEHFRKSHRTKMHPREKMCTKRRFP